MQKLILLPVIAMIVLRNFNLLILCCLIGLLIPISTIAQDMEKNRFTVRTHYGFVSAHRPHIAIFNEGHVSGLELSWSKRLFGKENWSSDFLNPEFGFTFMGLKLGNPELLGNGYGVCWFFNFPLIKNSKLEYNLYAGQGLGYIEKSFDVKDNFKNFANSNKVNGFVFLSNSLGIPIGKRFVTEFGLSFIHFSNGGMNKPNLGLNIPAVSFGLDYKIGSINKDSIQNNSGKKIKKMSLLTAAFGVKERRPAQNYNYMVYTLNYSKAFSKNGISFFGYGGDFITDEALRKEAKKEGDKNITFVDQMRIGAHIAYIFKTHPIHIIVEQGFYLYTPYKADGILYHRLGTRYRVTDNIMINTTLRTHFAVADHFEFGLTYRFK